MSKPKVNETCIQESRAFFGNLLADMVGNISNGEIISDTDRESLNNLQTMWINKYNPNLRMPEKLPLTKDGRVMKRKYTTKSQEGNKALRNINILESDFEELQKVDDNERIVMEIEVPKLWDDWRCATYTVTVPAHVAKENKLENLLTLKILRVLMRAPQKEANKLMQELIDNEFNSEIDDALMHG